jgi:CheY-like chemotaxis protein
MKKILLVEDEIILVFILKRFLERMGYQVVGVVADADAAIEAVGQYQPDLIIMDVFINGNRDGIETAGIIRNVSNVPVIFTTSCPDRMTIERADTVSGTMLLEKPVTETALSDALHCMLAEPVKCS